MNDTVDQTLPLGKIYKDKAFWVGTFLGGPLVAGYLFTENFKTLGQPEKVKPTWIISVIATLVIFGGIFWIPGNIPIPNQIIPIVYSAIAFGLFKKYQEENASKHIYNGGLVYSWGKVIVVGIIGLLITLAPIFTYVYLTDTLEQANISTKIYGETVKHEIDFDQSNISEQEIDKIGAGFVETGFFDLSIAKYIYVVKNGTKYEISISSIQGIEKDEDALKEFGTLRNQMDGYLPNKKVEFKLVVDYLDNVVKVLK